MSDKPERVWATMVDSECARNGTFVDLKEYPTKPNHDAIEYVRADLVQAAVAAALREAAEVARCSDFRHEAQDNILALITPDAQAALDRVVAAERVQMQDRIKELEERLKAATDDAKEAEAYAGELEAVLESIKAKMEKAVEALGTALSEMVDYADTHPAWSEIWEAREAARATLAELTGGKKPRLPKQTGPVEALRGGWKRQR